MMQNLICIKVIYLWNTGRNIYIIIKHIYKSMKVFSRGFLSDCLTDKLPVRPRDIIVPFEEKILQALQCSYFVTILLSREKISLIVYEYEITLNDLD